MLVAIFKFNKSTLKGILVLGRKAALRGAVGGWEDRGSVLVCTAGSDGR